MEEGMSGIVNRMDLDFLLHDVLRVGALAAQDRFCAYDRDTISAILDSAERIAATHYQPCAAVIDEIEPQFVDGKAITHPAVARALKEFAEAGFFAAGLPPEYGGMDLPTVVRTAVYGMFSCANLSIHNYAMLTTAAANLLATFGNADQRRRFLPPMAEGRWFGTMCLSETQAGSSLADIATRAEPRDAARGLYAIRGAKMWISGGDQDISENIIHMVLARIDGAPAGTAGISLFIVPKFLVDEAGQIGPAHNVTLAGLNHKMGNRGTTNAVLQFGEQGETLGWLVGEPHKGLGYMFQMMNEARIAVGHGAVMQGLGGFLASLAYAQERAQGRRMGTGPADAPLSIIHHADIKRLLLAQKAAVEGGLALVLYCALLHDRMSIATDAVQRADFHLLLDLLTPVAKSWPSEFCLEANKHAIQVLGGYGYTRDYPVERFYRDNRLNPIHEGTHGIQAIDLLGRKVRLAEGRALHLLLDEIAETLVRARSADVLSAEADALERAAARLRSATQAILAAPDRERQLANATLYLDAFGHIVVAWLWLKQGMAITEAEPEPGLVQYREGKLQAMRYFFRYELPRIENWLMLAGEMDETCLSLDPAAFIG
jgi:butyryl-CoA dehydrogenase